MKNYGKLDIIEDMSFMFIFRMRSFFARVQFSGFVKFTITNQSQMWDEIFRPGPAHSCETQNLSQLNQCYEMVHHINFPSNFRRDSWSVNGSKSINWNHQD